MKLYGWIEWFKAVNLNGRSSLRVENYRRYCSLKFLRVIVTFVTTEIRVLFCTLPPSRSYSSFTSHCSKKVHISKNKLDTLSYILAKKITNATAVV